MKLEAFGKDITPREFRQLGFTKNFRDISSGVNINTEAMTFVNEAYQDLIEWIYNQYGRFENPPLQITSESGRVYEYFFDLSQVDIGIHDIQCNLKSRKSESHFFDKASVVTFELLRKKGFLPDNLFVDVPYIIVPENLQEQQAIAIVTTLVLLYQLYTAIYEAAKIAAAFLDIPSGIIAAILQALALVVYLALTVIALIQAFLDLKELFFPKLRFFKAISDYDLIKQGCAYLGYNLQSQLLEIERRKVYTMGRPIAVPGQSNFLFTESEKTAFFNLGYPTSDDTTPTLWSLIEHYLKTYHAKLFAFEGEVILERDSFFQTTASIVLDPALTDQENSEDRYTFNEGEMWGRMYDHWQVDYSDAHSPDTYEGMKSEYITEPIVTLNPDLVRLPGLKENSAPFALAGRKSGLTKVEQFMELLFGQFANTIAQFGGIFPGLSGVVGREGVMVISNQYFEITKKLWLDVNSKGEGRQPADYKDYLSMDFIFNEYKMDLRVKDNNFALKTMRVPFTDEMFTSLLMNNYVIYKPTQEPVEIVNINFLDQEYAAEIDILLPDNSAFNTKTTKLA